MFARKLFVVWMGLLIAVPAVAGNLGNFGNSKSGLEKGKPDLKSAGPLAFGPEGILFVADTRSAAIFAIDTEDKADNGSRTPLRISGVDEKIAAMLGTRPGDILITDLAVNPESGKAYISVQRGTGPDGTPVLCRVEKAGKLSLVSLQMVSFSKAELPNPPEPGATRGKRQRRGNSRSQSITDIVYLDGRLLVAGLSNEEFASTLRSIPFPFDKVGSGTSVEIFHGAHGKFETRSPVRTFVPFHIAGEPHLLAAYQCTPLVKFPLSALKPGTHLKGSTVAELGNGNRPLDMIVYEQKGKDFLLLANTRRGIMKIPTDELANSEVTERVPRGEKAGVPYETIEDWKDIYQLDRFSSKYALVVRKTESGAMNLETLPLP